MSLIWVDSFDYATNSSFFTPRYDSWFSTTNSSASGRNGRGVSHGNVSNPCLRKNVPAHDTYIVGIAFNMSLNALLSSKQYIIIGFLDSVTTSSQVTLRMNSNNNLCVYRGSTLLGTGSTVISQSTWYYLEIKVVNHATAGTVEVRLNEEVEISLTGQNTAPSGTNQTTIIQIFNGSAMEGSDWNLSLTLDDFYIIDDQGTENNDFLGDIKVECLFPNGNGNSSQWTNKSGNTTNNYTYVDDTNPDDDTSYVEDGLAGDMDTYTLTDLASTAVTVLGVQVSSYAKKTDSGIKKMANVVRTNTTYYADSGKTLSDTYRYGSTIWDVNPNTSAAWTSAQINALEAGVKVIS